MTKGDRGAGRRLLVMVVAGALPFLAGMAAGGCVAGARDPAPTGGPVAGAVTPRARSEPGPGGDRVAVEPLAGIPMGWARSEAGARGAGLAVAATFQSWLYLTDVALAESISTVATADAAPRLIDELTGQVGLVRDALASTTGQVWWVVRPLAARMVSFGPDRAMVGVWVVSVLSAADVAVPQSSWSMVTVELAWVGGDWRVDGLSRRPGPTPILDASDQPWPPEALASALAGFELLTGGR
ncbi:MAG: hypothetical protein ACRD29_06730 [Acidimicrobiales bacterium]